LYRYIKCVSIRNILKSLAWVYTCTCYTEKIDYKFPVVIDSFELEEIMGELYVQYVTWHYIIYALIDYKIQVEHS
jgi:hypothetical protein